jgi:hypothetical protein
VIGVIALLGRPAFAENVRENFARQTHAERLLVVVEPSSVSLNVTAMGERDGLPYYECRAKPDRSNARNVGLSFVRALGCSYFAIFEDDDTYGPGYLAEHWANRERADVLGKAAHVIQGPDGSRWLANDGWQERPIELVGPAPGYIAGGLAAATLFGRVDHALPWPEPCPPWGEECEWYEAMLRAGRTLYSTSAEHFTRRRFEEQGHDHATPCDWRREIEDCNGVALTH